jgi:N-methylhydantoinase B
MTGPRGELVATSTGGIPLFVADSVGVAVRDGLQIHGVENMAQGDVFLCNHAAVLGQHLNNVVMYTPIFATAGQPIGFFAINVHWVDIGGRVIGSLSRDSTDIFMEGIQLRSVRLFKAGEPVDDVYRIIRDNTRFPAALMGDIEAQLAGCMLGRELVTRLADRYGVSVYLEAIAKILDQSERASRKKIAAIPDGTYGAEAFLDDDGAGQVPIKMRVIVDGSEMTVDFSEIAEQQKGSSNSGPHGGGITSARIAFKYLVASDESANEGTFRPLKVVLPAGKLVSAAPTAAMGFYSLPLPTVIDTIIKAFEFALPGSVTAGHFGAFSVVRFSGRRPNGDFFQSFDSGHGGWGAGATFDGSGPFRTMVHGDTRIIPVELQEGEFPYLVEELGLREDSAGAGRFRGGLGFRKRFRIVTACMLSVDFDRTACLPWGVHGGHPGTSGRVVVSSNGKETLLTKVDNYPLMAGDVVSVETGGGGGYGSPADRSPTLIERDLRRGYITADSARRDYGFSL